MARLYNDMMMRLLLYLLSTALLLPAQTPAPFDVVEATIAQVHDAMRAGRLTCRDLVGAYLKRIDAYDKNGPGLNSIVVVNPDVDKLFAEAAIAPTDAARQELYTKVQKLLADEVPVLWLLEMDFPTIYRCNIKNLVSTAIGVNDGFKDAWKE